MGIALRAEPEPWEGASGLPRLGGIRSAPLNKALELIHESISKLRYGHVVVYVQDGQVIQIDSTERIRLGRAGGSVAPGAGALPRAAGG